MKQNMKKLNLLFILSVLLLSLFLVSCQTNVSNNLIKGNNTDITIQNTLNVTNFKFVTKEGFEIYGTLYNAENEKNKVLLLHGFGQSQDNYFDLAKYLSDKGITAITMDFRGHGKSIFRENNELHSQDLTLDDYNSFAGDINGVVRFLESKNMSNNFSIVGSDIGANTALLFASQNKQIVNKVILISPSLNYYGITTKQAIFDYTNELYIVTSVNDDISFEPSQYLYDNSNSTKKQLKLYVGSEHGLSLLTKETGLKESIANWLVK
jgi:pimeloyl-ACP methyl ester carboxylesterase